MLLARCSVQRENMPKQWPVIVSTGSLKHGHGPATAIQCGNVVE
jgi:hypothetical protein